MIFVLWIIFSVIVGFIGSPRKVGFGGALLWSLLLSPLVGLLITLSSKRLEDVEREMQTAQEAKKQTAALEAMRAGSLADQLQRLAEMRDAGAITEEDYSAAKKKLLA